MHLKDFFKSQFSDKLTHAQKREKCSICACKKIKHSPVRKHKCCNTFTCYECFDAWYRHHLEEINCFVCNKKYNITIPETYKFWFSRSSEPALPIVAVPHNRAIDNQQVNYHYNFIDVAELIDHGIIGMQFRPQIRINRTVGTSGP